MGTVELGLQRIVPDNKVSHFARSHNSLRLTYLRVVSPNQVVLSVRDDDLVFRIDAEMFRPVEVGMTLGPGLGDPEPLARPMSVRILPFDPRHEARCRPFQEHRQHLLNPLRRPAGQTASSSSFRPVFRHSHFTVSGNCGYDVGFQATLRIRRLLRSAVYSISFAVDTDRKGSVNSASKAFPPSPK